MCGIGIGIPAASGGGPGNFLVAAAAVRLWVCARGWKLKGPGAGREGSPQPASGIRRVWPGGQMHVEAPRTKLGASPVA